MIVFLYIFFNLVSTWMKRSGVFEVKTVDEFKKLLDNTNDSLDRMGVYKIPRLNDGLVYNKVGSMD